MDENTKTNAITIRIPAEVYNWLSEQAKSERRSLNAQIVHVLTDYHDMQTALKQRVDELERTVAANQEVLDTAEKFIVAWQEIEPFLRRIIDAQHSAPLH